MGFYQSVVRPVLFSLDPERAHNLGLWAVGQGLLSIEAPNCQPTTLFGVQFRNRVGLAAGFDKDGVGLDHWKDLGFGFVEVGTVTRHPQPGNEPPRLFRLPEDRAVINRMGFNNAGADALARRLESASPGIPVGVNIGKSKVTPLETAAEDYCYTYRLLAPLADYVVVNVSSPNTPGLRGLQDRGPLGEILNQLKEIDAVRPLFVKVSPDLEPGQLEDVVEVALGLGLTGIVATNTTISREGLTRDPGFEGGLSGAPLTDRATKTLRQLKAQTGCRLVLIGVGGIMSGEDAKARLAAGADLVQVYTGWVYGGPNFASEVALATGP